MPKDLIRLRDEIVAGADRAIDAAWPERRGDIYVREMTQAVGELERIAAEMATAGFDRVEQSRTYRLLGSLHADLEPALGIEMLRKAVSDYRKAEELLEGESDELERAKLNFNYANTLRQLGRNDTELLEDAKRRLLSAEKVFVASAPQYSAQTAEALASVESLLPLARLSAEVETNRKDMADLQKELAAGGNVREIAKKTRELMKRGGGVAGMVGQLQGILETLPVGQRQKEKFIQIQRQMQELTDKVFAEKEMSPEVKQIWSLLNERLKSDAESRKISKDHLETIKDVMEGYARILTGDESDVGGLLEKVQKSREFVRNEIEMAHYMSHGIERPPVGSQGARLVELNWQLRRYLLEEMNRSGKGEEESREILDLSKRASSVDRRIYEAGSDDARASVVAREELRPLAVAVRDFSARTYAMPARPIWRSARVTQDTNSVFCSGSPEGRGSIRDVCKRAGLDMMAEPRGESYAGARWNQLQKCMTSVFDLRDASPPKMAEVMYELGIALTLGKPAIVLVEEGQALPFDVEIDPVVLTGGPHDDAAIAAALDNSIVSVRPRPLEDASSCTLKYVLSMYPRPQPNVYADQTIRMLSEMTGPLDPLSISRTVGKLFEFLNDGETILVHPTWSPAYPEGERLRLFHVTAFGPKWAGPVTKRVRDACKSAGVAYVRGDEVEDPNVIRSIWQEIARATHVLVDITGFNPNVALELGIAHTLGKKVLTVAQGDPRKHLFPSISKLRVYRYDLADLEGALGREVKKLVKAGP